MKVIIFLTLLLNILIKVYHSLRLENNLKISNSLKKVDKKKSLAENFLSIKKPQGHVEKFMRYVEEIVYIPGNKPSGLPGSFVISEEEAKGKDPRIKN